MSRLAQVNLDEASLAATSSDAEHERRIAIFDLLEGNKFEVVGVDSGPYTLDLSVVEQRLVWRVSGADGAEVRTLVLSLAPLRKLIRDYFMVCESYYEAIRGASAQQIEAIDMGRRALHNEGSETLAERLKGKIDVDHDTARRLFTLICALHVRG